LEDEVPREPTDLADEIISKGLGSGEYQIPNDNEEERDNLVYVERSRHWEMEGILDDCNTETIRESLSKFPDDIVQAKDGAFLVRIRKKDGSFTPGFIDLCEIEAALANYPVLDDMQYSATQFEHECENIREEARNLRDVLPDDWVSQVFGWLSDNHSEGSTADDGIRWWAPSEIEPALIALGFHEICTPHNMIQRRMVYRGVLFQDDVDEDVIKMIKVFR
jgi:hypothetical protein